jgi:hypothetical protein
MKSALLDRFYARYPNLRVEFVMSDQYVDLARGDADVALRSGDTDDDALVGRKIADSLWSVYASKAYIDRNGRPESIVGLAQHATVGFDGPLASDRAAKWLQEVAPMRPLPPASPVCSASSPSPSLVSLSCRCQSPLATRSLNSCVCSSLCRTLPAAGASSLTPTGAGRPLLLPSSTSSPTRLQRCDLF